MSSQDDAMFDIDAFERFCDDLQGPVHFDARTWEVPMEETDDDEWTLVGITFQTVKSL